jgi:hypothetical protein
MVLPFQNCGEPTHLDSSFLASLGNFKGCEGPLKNLFATTYYPLALQKCSACHATGPGTGLFANKNFETAFLGFSSLGHLRWERNAVNSAHHPPYTGPANQSLVNQYSATFGDLETAYNLCVNPGAPAVIKTVGKANPQILQRATQANANNRFASLAFDLDVDMAQVDPTLPPVIKFPATFSIDVTVAHAGGVLTVNSGYEFRNPTITLKATAPAGSTIHVKGIRLIVNGQMLSDLTSYSLLMADVTGTTPVNLAPGFAFGLAIYTPVMNTDLISIQFDELSMQ